jgi:hypothetical protein
MCCFLTIEDEGISSHYWKATLGIRAYTYITIISTFYLWFLRKIVKYLVASVKINLKDNQTKTVSNMKQAGRQANLRKNICF